MKKEKVIIFEGEHDFVLPKSRIRDKKTGISYNVEDFKNLVNIGEAPTDSSPENPVPTSIEPAPNVPVYALPTPISGGGGGGTTTSTTIETTTIAPTPTPTPTAPTPTPSPISKKSLLEPNVVLGGAQSIPTGTETVFSTPAPTSNISKIETPIVTTTSVIAPDNLGKAPTPTFGGGAGGGGGTKPKEKKKSNYWWLLILVGIGGYMYYKKKK